jgi:hypothetical protein
MARNRIDARTHPVPLFEISRRDLIVGGGAMVAAFGLPMALLADQPTLRARQLRTTMAKEKIL